MLTIINDPTGATGWERHEWDCSLTIQQNIERHLTSGEGCEVRINGLPIDPSRDPVMDTHPRPGDVVVVSQRPAGPVGWFVAAMLAVTAVVYSLIPKINPNASADAPKESPNNRLTAQTNTARAYQAIPDVYGSRRVWPDLIQPAVVRYVNHVKHVTELMCVSRGKGVITDVRYADTSLIGDSSSSFEVFSPTFDGIYAENGVTYVPNVVEAFATPDVDGQEIGLARIGPFNTATEAQLLWWNVVFPRGLKGTVELRFAVTKVNEFGGAITGVQHVYNKTYTADTYDARYFTEEYEPPDGPGRYAFSAVRLNAEKTDGTDVAKLESLYAIKKYAAKAFPGVTLIRVTTKATEAATSFRERKINLWWQRHVRNTLKDPTALAPSKNFALAIAHLWSLSGRSDAELDLDALEAINTKYGIASPLLEFNGSLDDADMSLGERVRLIADHARVVVWRDGTKWTFTRDEARDFPSMQFDYLNLAPAESTRSYSAHLPSTNDGVELEYVDPVTQSRKVYVRLKITNGALATGSSANPLKVRLLGCTNATQASDRATLEARRLIYQRDSLKLQALSDAIDLGPGSLIRWVDPDDFYADDKLQAGEVLSITDKTIKTSEPLRWDGQTQGRMLFTDKNGRYTGAAVVCTPADGGAVLASVPSGLYVASGVQQLGSRYVFAVGLTAAELESASLWTVTGTTPNTDGTVSVACVNYDSRIYSGAA